MRQYAIAIVIVMVVGAAVMPAAAQVAAQDARLLQPADFSYLGAFRLPQDAPEDTGWLYAGQALAYVPDGDPAGPDDGFPGSLYGTGHDWHQWVSEISIPAPVIVDSVAALNTATTLQPFTDVRGDLYDYLEQPRAALAYLPPADDQDSGKLVFAWGAHLDTANFAPAHGWFGRDLGDPQVAGLWAIAGREHYETVDYLFPVDPAWAADHAPGFTLVTGRFRDGGQAGCGPNLFLIAPRQAGNPPAPGTELPAITLLRYGNFDAPDDQKLANYHHGDEWSGGAWVTAGARAAVVLVGTKGLGEAWYGFSNGVVWPEEGPWPEVPAYPHDQRGWWSTDFEAQFLLYDPADLAAVARGDLEPWQPQPYAVFSVDDVLFDNDDSPVQKTHRLGAAAFDRANGLLYVAEPTAYEDAYTVIHVWRVG